MTLKVYRLTHPSSNRVKGHPAVSGSKSGGRENLDARTKEESAGRPMKCVG